MGDEDYSIIIWCWHDQRTDATLLRLVRVDTREEVPLRNGSFLVRISIDERNSVVRCYIRHTTSGRDTYVQGGPKLRTFIKDCLLTEVPQATDIQEPPEK